MTALNKQAQAIISDIRLKRGSGDVYAPIIRWDEFEVITGALEDAEKRIAELESAFQDGWQFEECESEGCENGAIFNVGTGINNIHVCEKCASEERYFRLKKSALPKRLPFKFAAGIGVKGGE